MAVFLCLLTRMTHAGAAPGPDSFGYTASATTNYSFVQITNGTGTRVLAFNDDAAVTANLGFNFNFYGTNYSTVSFNVNGLMTFVTPSEEYANVNVTTTSPTNNQPAIAVLWDDWETQETWADAIYYKTAGTSPFRQFIVQWNKVVPVNGDGTNTVTFEAILFEGSNRILLSYFDAVVSDETTNAASLGAGATVGIRDRNGQTNNRNLQWSFNQAVITNGLNVLFAATNHAPITTNDTATTLEDTAVTINVITNDVDQDGDALTITAVTQGTNGAVANNGNGTVLYSPATNFFGTDFFTYTISDGFGRSATGGVSITVLPVNDPPTLSPLSNLTLDEDAGVQTVSLSGISSGATNEPDTLSVSASSSNPALIPTPTVTYSSPNATGMVSFASVTNGFGSATITVTVNDGRGSNNIASRAFTVTVNPVNDPPTLNPLSDITVNEDSGQIQLFMNGITSGASNEPDALSVSASSSDTNVIPQPTVNYTSPNTFGLLYLNPAANAFGVVTISVTVNDGRASNNIVSRSFTVTINSVNDLPTITTVANQTNDANTVVGPLPFTVGDIETPATNLTISAISTNQTLVPTNNIQFGGAGSNRTVTITPATNQSGTTVITLTVHDTDGGSASTAFLLRFLPVNHPPLAGPDTGDTYRNVPLQLPASLVLANDTDPDPGDTLTITNVSNSTAAGGTASLSNYVVTYSPPTDFTGADSFSYVVTDPQGSMATGTVAVTVWPSLQIDSIARHSDGLVVLGFRSISNRIYSIEASSNVLDWESLGAAAETAPGQFQFQDTNAAALSSKLYRVRWP